MIKGWMRIFITVNKRPSSILCKLGSVIVLVIICFHFEFSTNVINSQCRHANLHQDMFSFTLKTKQEVNDIKVVKQHEVNTNIFSLFKIMQQPTKTCLHSVKLIIMVKSSVINNKQRDRIRTTWGKRSHNQDFCVFFHFGDFQNLTNSIYTEAETFGDIIQGSFVDNYRNNTFKIAMAFKWVSDNFEQLTSILFVDDDFSIDTGRLLDFCAKYTFSQRIFGELLNCSAPVRIKLDKSFISYEEYPLDYYPPYVGAGFILTNSDVVREISKMMPYVKQISIDDIYVAVIAHILKIELFDISRFMSRCRSTDNLIRHCYFFKAK